MLAKKAALHSGSPMTHMSPIIIAKPLKWVVQLLLYLGCTL